MKTAARISALADTAVLELSKRIERKRRLLSGNRLQADIVPSESGQGLLRRMGLGRVDIALSPELTMAKILKEWRSLDALHRKLEGLSADKTTAEKIADYFVAVNNRISVLESRVFGNNVGRNYPQFKVPGEWLAWRLNLAHPGHRCNDPSSGWRPELYDWAFEESRLAFG